MSKKTTVLIGLGILFIGLLTYGLYNKGEMLRGAFQSFNIKNINPSEETCKDSDGGIDLYTIGTVEDLDPESIWYGLTYIDTCTDDDTVTERYCHEEGYMAQQPYNCPTGYACTDGACVLQPYLEVTGVEFKASNEGQLTPFIMIKNQGNGVLTEAQTYTVTYIFYPQNSLAQGGTYDASFEVTLKGKAQTIQAAPAISIPNDFLKEIHAGEKNKVQFTVMLTGDAANPDKAVYKDELYLGIEDLE